MTDDGSRESPTTRLSTGEAFSSQQHAPVTGVRLSPVELPVVSEESGFPVPENHPQKILHVIVGLLPLGILAGVAVSWSFFGKIPVEVEGRAVLITPRSNVEFQSRASGQILAIKVKPGETVKAGQVLVTLDLPELKEELENKQQKLAQLRAENVAITAIQNQGSQLKQESLQTQRQVLPGQRQSIQTRLDANQRQRQAYKERITQLNTINKLILARLEAYNRLTAEGAIATLNVTGVQILQAEQNNRNEITNLQAKIEDLNADSKAWQVKLVGLNAQAKNLANQSSQLVLSDLEANTKRQNQITDLEREIANLKVKIRTQSQAISTHAGQVIDIAVNPSQVVTAGTRLGTLQVVGSDTQATGLTFFKVGDADRIQPGMQVEITPDIHDRARFGGIVAEVTSVSRATVTSEQVASIVGNEQLAKNLLIDTPTVLVRAKLHLNPHTVSGYEWTQGEGPPQKIPESATATARVIVEKRTLVSYIIPTLRQFTGIY